MIGFELLNPLSSAKDCGQISLTSKINLEPNTFLQNRPEMTLNKDSDEAITTSGFVSYS